MRHIHWLEKIVGALFIFAAVFKALDLSAFAAQINYYGVLEDLDWIRCAAVGSLVVETLLGIVLLVGLRFRGLTFWATLLMLIGFTGLILYGWLFNNLADCGCFGKIIKMGPKTSIAKNFIMMAMLIASWLAARKTHPAAQPSARHVTVKLGACVASLLAVGLAVAFGANANFFNPPVVEQNRPFAQFKFEFEGQQYDLGQEGYLVCMLSADCDHCQGAVAALNEIAVSPGFPPVVGLMLGDEEQLERFRLLTDPQFPTVLIDSLVFTTLVGDFPPRFYLVREGVPLRFVDILDPAFEDIVAFIMNELPPTAPEAPATTP